MQFAGDAHALRLHRGLATLRGTAADTRRRARDACGCPRRCRRRAGGRGSSPTMRKGVQLLGAERRAIDDRAIQHATRARPRPRCGRRARSRRRWRTRARRYGGPPLASTSRSADAARRRDRDDRARESDVRRSARVVRRRRGHGGDRRRGSGCAIVTIQIDAGICTSAVRTTGTQKVQSASTGRAGGPAPTEGPRAAAPGDVVPRTVLVGRARLGTMLRARRIRDAPRTSWRRGTPVGVPATPRRSRGTAAPRPRRDP